MAPVPHRSRSPRPILDRLFYLVALLAWVGQLAVLGAPLIEAATDAAAAPHVEAHSNPLHHGHNPDLCPGCSVHALVGLPVAGRPPVPVVETGHDQPLVTPLLHGGDADAIAVRPRAPPVWKSQIRSHSRFDSDFHNRHSHAIRTLAVRARGGRGGHGAGAAAFHAA
jgi:hypothetical protein